MQSDELRAIQAPLKDRYRSEPGAAQITLKALSFFDDGNLRQLLQTTKDRLAKAAREADLDHLPVIGPIL